MAITHADLLKDPYIFNSDRNCWMSGGGTHTWSSDISTTHTWTFTAPIYISWLANRGTSSASNRGTATFNQILATTIPIPLDYVAYVTLGPSQAPGVPLAISVAPGATLPQSDNLFVLCSHKQLSGVATNQNPLMMRWGNSIAVGQSYNATAGFPTLGYTNSVIYGPSTSWTVNHGLNSPAVLIQCYDSMTYPANVIWPQSFQATDANNMVVTWSSAVSGRAVVMKIV